MRVATSIREILDEHGYRLRQLRGVAIRQAQVVFYDPWDALHAASPVVCELETGTHLEIWTIYVTELGFTWDAINLSEVPFSWDGSPDRNCRWIINGHPVLAAQLPNRISGVNLLRVDVESDICAGVEFVFSDDRRLFVANYSDDLYVGTRMPPNPLEILPL